MGALGYCLAKYPYLTRDYLNWGNAGRSTRSPLQARVTASVIEPIKVPFAG